MSYICCFGDAKCSSSSTEYLLCDRSTWCSCEGAKESNMKEFNKKWKNHKTIIEVRKKREKVYKKLYMLFSLFFLFFNKIHLDRRARVLWCKTRSSWRYFGFIFKLFSTMFIFCLFRLKFSSFRVGLTVGQFVLGVFI